MSLYKRAKDFNESIEAGDVVVKHVDDEAGSRHHDDGGDIPF